MPVQTEHTNHFGIEVVSGVTWKGWEPGGEYTKQIVLKNVQIKTQKLKYKVPSTRFFTTLYPKPIVLSSGTSFVLPVTFRPLEKGPYEDYLEFEANEGSFSVPMRAVLPSADITVPDNLTFGLCAVKDSVQATFEVTNNSELITAFQWEVAEPFSLQPTSGTLAPKTSCSITATFNPKAALVYEGVAVCKYGATSEKSSTKHTQIEGIGKFPHLVATLSGRNQTTSEASNEVLVNFGEVPVQTTEEKWINLHNFSPVSAPFQVLQPSSALNIDTVFSCSQYHGVVAPQSTAKIKMSFSPHTPGTLSTDIFEVAALGATNCAVIKCVGTGKGPAVALDGSFLDFGVLESGKQFNRTFKITNTSSVPAAFQFMIDCDQSVFKLDTVCSLLAGNSSQTIIAHFKPVHPINYYRKLTCLVQNQDPLFIDFFGTCHTELVKPAVLQTKHLERYKVHVKRGFSKTAPEQLNELLREKKLQLDEEGAVISQEAQSASCEGQLNQDLSPMEEFFDGSLVGETTCNVPHVSLDVRHLDFGRIPDARAVEQKTINITNHTKGKITCTWMKDCRGVFSVTPEEFDILPLRTASFRVTFRPDAANQFFSAELECYAFYKSMRDYRLVEDNTLCPPWCLTLKSSGHTFTMGTETFIPRCQWDTKHLVFPAAIPNHVAYKTLLLTNTGPNPVQFDFEEDSSGIFTCQPSKGLLKDKYQLVVFRMAPPDAKPFKHTVKCQLNDASNFTEEIHLTGSAEIPQVQFDIKGPLYFKPTCLGSASTKILAVKNTSRIPLWFQWSIAGSDAKVMNVAESEGMILPNDVQFHAFTFTPLEETKYLAKAKLHVRSSAEKNERAQSEKKYLIRAIGEGAIGSIVCTEPLVDLGDVIVGSSISRSLTIHNNSNCSLQYDLLVDQDIQGPYDDEGSIRDVLALELSKTTGVIPSRTSHQIDVLAFPTRRVTYTFKVRYKLVATNDDGKQHTTRQKTPLVELRCQGVYPTLSVSDIRCLGSGKTFSKVQLWKLFSLDSLNECLDADPSPSELMYAVATRHSTTRRVPVYTRAIMDFNFSAAPIGDEPCVVHLNLQNTGTVPAEWAFLYPSDLQLELEYWAETGEYSKEELHEMQVMDNKLFTVEPKSGLLAPGESKTVVLSYRHLFIGMNKLPVLFKVSRGREILLNFVGVTVDPQSYYVHFASTKHMFEPVPIGSSSPPVQVYELYNGGAQTVKYELELEPLAQVEAANYGCRVLECLNPTGEIQPGCTAPIHWVFAPLEAKTYMVDIPVHILGGDTVLVTFTGVGYDQRIMGNTMPFRETASAVPEQQLVQVSQQLARLSVERIAFGNIPLFSISHQVFVLTNNSKEHIISFRWILEGSQNVIMIEPYHGYLRPKEDVLLKISFFSCMAPSLYDLDIVCEIVNETKMAEYNQQMIDWSNKQEEKQHTFTITEADVKAEKKTEKRPHSGPRLASLQKSQQSFSKSEGDLRKYNALPPIGSPKSPGKERKRKTKEEQNHPQPTPPEAFLLHLGVTARTHSIAEFYQNFSSSVENFFIDQRYVVSQGRKSTQETEQLAALASCSKEELDVTASVLSVILRGLLEDDGFQHGLDDVAKEPVPYFRQLCESPYPSSRPASAETNGSRSSRSPSDLEPTNDDVEFEPELDFGHQTPPDVSEDKVITRIHETTQRPPSSALSMADKLSEDEGNLEMRMTQRQTIRSLPEFESMVEAVLENTLSNILVEANRGEVNLTARPRVIALPPSRVNRATR